MDALSSSFQFGSTLIFEADGGAGLFSLLLAATLALVLAAQILLGLRLARETVSLRKIASLAGAVTLLGSAVGFVALLSPSFLIFSTTDLAPTARVSLAGLSTAHALSFGFSLDRLSGLMVALVGLIGWAVLRFSDTYLKGESRRGRFLGCLLFTIVLVQLFALQTNLLGHGLLWLLISVSVHRLLRHYEERPRARLAAKKKFLTSRAADLAFYSALWLFYREFGTLDVGELASVSQATSSSELGAVLLVLAALMKSAQFPLHSWLPDTMDAPTPVSAIMHAGVVNAGALLLLRNGALLSQHTVALSVLILVGGTSAAFGTLVGSVQPSIKLRLAYSTIAQMGFLFFELGLGLSEAAVLHLVAHALYKAHAFLRSGSAHARYQPSPLSLPKLVSAVGLSLVVYGAVFFFLARLWELDIAAYLPLGLVWALGASQFLLGPSKTSFLARLRNFLTVGLSLWALCFVAEVVLASWLPRSDGFLSGGPSMVIATGLSLTLLSAALFLSSSDRLRSSALRGLYVHALSGFYFGEWTDRVTRRLWPDVASKKASELSVLPLKKAFQ